MISGQAERAFVMNPQDLNAFDLGRLLEPILRSWGADHIRILGAPPEISNDLTLERSLTLGGPLNGFLTARCSPEFASWLRDQRQDTPLGRYPVEDVFEELVSFFCLSLSHRFWRPHSSQIGTLKPFPSQPEYWPLVPPQAACLLEVEGYEVELRLWVKD